MLYDFDFIEDAEAEWYKTAREEMFKPDQALRIILEACAYDEFDPEDWWTPDRVAEVITVREADPYSGGIEALVRLANGATGVVTVIPWHNPGSREEPDDRGVEVEWRPE